MSTNVATLNSIAEADDRTTGIETDEQQQVEKQDTTSQAAPAQPTAEPNPSTSNAFAITSFVLGIASIVSSWTFIAPIVGLIFGILALRRKTQERTLALWGLWMNAAMLALTALVALAVATFVGFAFIAGAVG